MISRLSAPLYRPGQIIDLTHKSTRVLPIRIKVIAVYQKEGSTCWMYDVLTEVGRNQFVDENTISSRETKHSSRCYSNPDIAKLLKDGYRFCGNYCEDTARDKANNLISNVTIEHIVLFPSVSNENKKLDGCYGIWIKYVCTIPDITEEQNKIQVK